MLKKARKSKKMSQKKLAKKLGISQSYVSKLENRKSTENITISLMKRISIELNLNPVDVFLYFYSKSKL